jgi:hypothetical protein
MSAPGPEKDDVAGRVMVFPGLSTVIMMRELLRTQKESWPRLRQGYDGLDRVTSRRMEFDGVTIRLEYNPARIVSTSAPVDERSVRERKCFLCTANLPPAQRGILYGEDHIILCNPFPIFREHFTIPHRQHTPQRINGMFGRFLALARDLHPRYTVLYNGPRSGASAPDHQHFQAGERGFLEIEPEYVRLIGGGRTLAGDAGSRVIAVDDGLRRWFAIEGGHAGRVSAAFDRIALSLSAGAQTPDEPMMNILAWYAEGKWSVLVFPRARHRPSFYFAEGDARIMISPAGTDCGGVCVTPVEKDFDRLTPETVRQMYGEIMIAPDLFASACDRVQRSFNADPPPAETAQ